MLWIWWPGFVVPVCMVLGGLGWKCVKRLPYRRKEALTAEQLRLARETFSRTLWQVGLALAAGYAFGAADECAAPGAYDGCCHCAANPVHKAGGACGAALFA